MDLSNANPARGHKEVRRSTGHIMVTARYSDQQGSKSRQNPCQVQPTENIGNLSGSRQCLWVRTMIQFLLSGVLQIFRNLNYKLKRRLSDVLPNQQSRHKEYEKFSSSYYTIGGLHEDKLCDILQAMAPTNVGTVHQTSLFHIESNHDRLGLLSPTHGQRSQQQSGQITLHLVLINKPKFLKATYHTERRKIEIPRSMGVEALTW